jgi:hypothetical protein
LRRQVLSHQGAPAHPDPAVRPPALPSQIEEYALGYDDIDESNYWLRGLLNETPADRPGAHIGPPGDRLEIKFETPRKLIQKIRIVGELTGFSVIGTDTEPNVVAHRWRVGDECFCGFQRGFVERVNDDGRVEGVRLDDGVVVAGRVPMIFPRTERTTEISDRYARIPTNGPNEHESMVNRWIAECVSSVGPLRGQDEVLVSETDVRESFEFADNHVHILGGLRFVSTGQSLIKKIEIFAIRPRNTYPQVTEAAQTSTLPASQRLADIQQQNALLRRRLEDTGVFDRANVHVPTEPEPSINRANIRVPIDVTEYQVPPGAQVTLTEGNVLRVDSQGRAVTAPAAAREFRTIRSNSRDHFTEPLRMGASSEGVNLAGLASNKIIIKNVKVRAAQDLNLEVFFWKTDNFNQGDIDADSFGGSVGLGGEGSSQVSNDGWFYSMSGPLEIPYEDLDDSWELHLSLCNRGHEAKRRGAEGAVSVEVEYEPIPEEVNEPIVTNVRAYDHAMNPTEIADISREIQGPADSPVNVPPLRLADMPEAQRRQYEPLCANCEYRTALRVCEVNGPAPTGNVLCEVFSQRATDSRQSCMFHNQECRDCHTEGVEPPSGCLIAGSFRQNPAIMRAVAQGVRLVPNAARAAVTAMRSEFQGPVPVERPPSYRDAFARMDAHQRANHRRLCAGCIHHTSPNNCAINGPHLDGSRLCNRYHSSRASRARRRRATPPVRRRGHWSRDRGGRRRYTPPRDEHGRFLRRHGDETVAIPASNDRIEAAVEPAPAGGPHRFVVPVDISDMQQRGPDAEIALIRTLIEGGMTAQEAAVRVLGRCDINTPAPSLNNAMAAAGRGFAAAQNRSGTPAVPPRNDRTGLWNDATTREVYRMEPYIISVDTPHRPVHGMWSIIGEYRVPAGINFTFTEDLKPLFRFKPPVGATEDWKRNVKVRVEITEAFGSIIRGRIYEASLEDYDHPQVPEDDHYRIMGRANQGDIIRVAVESNAPESWIFNIQVRLQANRLIQQIKRKSHDDRRPGGSSST